MKKASELKRNMCPGTSKLPQRTGRRSCHLRLHTLRRISACISIKGSDFPRMRLQLLPVSLPHFDVLLTRCSFKEKIPLEDVPCHAPYLLTGWRFVLISPSLHSRRLGEGEKTWKVRKCAFRKIQVHDGRHPECSRALWGGRSRDCHQCTKPPPGRKAGICKALLCLGHLFSYSPVTLPELRLHGGGRCPLVKPTSYTSQLPQTSTTPSVAFEHRA